ncbi:DUF6778 family protein [Sulfitobacter aestuarii]|uniref:DUF6778 family protein n=1 Tax=Sulfitobacter aestuarii TaxID=2161676 RepID=A0ABW5U0H8_9RHOB
MKAFKLIAALGLGVIVSACAAPQTVSRNATATASLDMAGQRAAAPLQVRKINVSVPRSLEVSEANRYYPSGDIVWREDPIGDRHAQVKTIFEDALAAGTADLKGRPVVLDVEVTRFHALTEKTRYSVGGIHSIKFLLTVRDARSGAVLAPTREIEADLRGYGGKRAIAAEQRGETQKVRISAHLGNVIRAQLQQTAAAMVAGATSGSAPAKI